MTDKLLLEVENLAVHYETDGGMVKTLNGADIHIGVGETLGLVGEAGTRRTTLTKEIMRLIPNPPGKIPGGEVIFEGQDLLKLSTNGMEAIRSRDTSMIFQDPIISLNPMLTVGEQIMEVIENHDTSLSRQETREWAENMLEGVGIPAERFRKYPHQLSGGMKQRVAVAIALTCNPKLLIADESTTALDVTVQAQMLEMIYKLKSENNISMILVTHDLGVIVQNRDYAAITYAREVVECGALREIYRDAKHPCTEGLLGSIPSLASDVKRPQAADGMMPDPTKLLKGCVLCERCKYVAPECSKTRPGMVTAGGAHQVRCIHYHQEEEIDICRNRKQRYYVWNI